MIDINQPVEQGHDMVLNNLDGLQELGTAEEFTKRKEAGDLIGLHTNPVVPASEAVQKFVDGKKDESNDESGNKEEDMNSGPKLSDEQDNPAAEERTQGEVEQTEEVRREAQEAEKPSETTTDGTEPNETNAQKMDREAKETSFGQTDNQ